MRKNIFDTDFYRVRVLSDLSTIVITYFIISLLSHRNLFNYDRDTIICLLVSWYFLSKWIGIYDDFRTQKFVDEFLLLMPLLAIQCIVVIVLFFITGNHDHARKFVLEFILLLTVLISLKKYIGKKAFQFLRVRGKNEKRVLIIGSNSSGLSFYDFLKSNPHFGYNAVGFVDNVKSESLNGQYKGNLKEIENVISQYQVDELVISLPAASETEMDFVISVAEKKAIRTRIIPEYFKANSNKYKMEMFGHFPIITVRNEPLSQSSSRIFKRVMDITISLSVIIFILSWLVPIVAILIKLDSKGSIFYLQDRWGRNNEPFKCYKFRSMRNNSKLVVDGKFQQTKSNDNRITRIGAFLRRTSLDEFPQFFNVLFGSMSIVGPRPHAVPHNVESQVLINNYSIRHWVKPGITGWAQVNGLRGETKDFQLMRQRVEFDIWYIENWTPWLDVKIFIKTIYDFIKGDQSAY